MRPQAAKKQRVRDFLKSKAVPKAIAMHVHNFYNYAASKEIGVEEVRFCFRMRFTSRF